MIDVQIGQRHLVIGRLQLGDHLPAHIPDAIQRTITEVPAECPNCRATAIVEPTCRQCWAATKGRARCACGATNDDREVRCLLCARHWYLIREGE